MRPALKKSIITETEFCVLKNLHMHYVANRERPATEISQIAIDIGVKDKDEVLRALYILEGRSLVSPEPAGSFTSNSWKITEIGIRAYDLAIAM
ncbi:MAG: hypothetical protein LBE20_06800 [Deltaproteobacteria bacterium]|jgi:putative aminopeptidase FrvX|nr:hypothetical protein [Deltaproteobacteria bacterium]